jgi:hypothetical protein
VVLKKPWDGDGRGFGSGEVCRARRQEERISLPRWADMVCVGDMVMTRKSSFVFVFMLKRR